ncbi:SDR family oxidoreductase [uncultured Brachybacterium sp.]|uniref:SDR family oxidoreductase n=1 Tax=uncultured Brachybacterium sp. TaxID=189680 RepID=UPI00260A54C7|nr:SDR family oxidoreductase [uncultured Brachybacterium sp.]
MTSPAVLITGATRGIGRAVADELAADHHLLLGGRDLAALEQLAAQYPSAQPFAAELTDAPALQRAVAALELPEGLAGVVHSAGILVSGSIEQLSAEEWTQSFAVNVVAVAELTRLLLPALRTARGTVVTINSGSGFTAGAGGGAYSASKFALRALSDSLRAEEREHGVRVSSIHPGRVATDMQRQLRAFEGGEFRAEDYMDPATVAATVGLALRLPAEASVDSLSVRPR